MLGKVEQGSRFNLQYVQKVNLWLPRYNNVQIINPYCLIDILSSVNRILNEGRSCGCNLTFFLRKI